MDELIPDPLKKKTPKTKKEVIKKKIECLGFYSGKVQVKMANRELDIQV